MNETLIKNWNSTVAPKDTVYVLGDLMFSTKRSDVTNLIRRLNGHIHWIWGNHDEKLKNAEGAAWAGYYKEIKINKQKFVLSHYPMMSWNGQYRGSIMLHGHCHGNLKHDGTKLIMDVGVDCWDYTPVSAETIMKEAEKIKKNNAKRFKSEIVTDDHH
jgi:calcineurin-like phosphoesterase family protein